MDLNDFSPEDPEWAEFFEKPFVLVGDLAVAGR